MNDTWKTITIMWIWLSLVVIICFADLIMPAVTTIAFCAMLATFSICNTRGD